MFVYRCAYVLNLIYCSHVTCLLTYCLAASAIGLGVYCLALGLGHEGNCLGLEPWCLGLGLGVYCLGLGLGHEGNCLGLEPWCLGLGLGVYCLCTVFSPLC